MTARVTRGDQELQGGPGGEVVTTAEAAAAAADPTRGDTATRARTGTGSCPAVTRSGSTLDSAGAGRAWAGATPAAPGSAPTAPARRW